MFQPCHGRAPGIVGKGTANPVAIILSGAMLLDWLADRHDDQRCRTAALAVRDAVARVLATGPRTPTLGGSNSISESPPQAWPQSPRHRSRPDPHPTGTPKEAGNGSDDRYEAALDQ